MVEKYRVKWSREETILAFDLYCRTPYSKISKTNTEIIELASLLGRTPSSVSLKMGNLAHFDPEIQAKNLSGMSNASKLDKEIVQEFFNDWTALSYQAQIIKSNLLHISVEDCLKNNLSIDISCLPDGDYRDSQVRTRVGQQFFRTTVLTAYRNRCCITEVSLPELLVASHLKPWKDCDSKRERTNPCNGLCLNAFHDKAFDRGLITLDNNYRVVISKRLNDSSMDTETKEWLSSYRHKTIEMPDKFCPDKKFIEYHNDMIFQR